VISGHFISEEIETANHWIGGWMGPRADLDVERGGKKKSGLKENRYTVSLISFKSK
jgi:hypothetical protein